MEKSIENMCVRNKVKKNKVISISGPTVCACCGDAGILEYNYDDEDPYANTGDVYCEECKGENICSNCGQFVSPAQRLVAKYVNNNAQEKEYCVKFCIKYRPVWLLEWILARGWWNDKWIRTEDWIFNDWKI